MPTVDHVRRRAEPGAPDCGRRRATIAAGRAARAASTAAMAKAGRNDRVTASVTVSIRSSRARAIALSPSAPRLSNSAARSGTWPRGASSMAVRSAHVTGILSDSGSSVTSSVWVAPSVARSIPATRLVDNTGAISASPSTRPAWRAPTVTAPARTGGASDGTADASSTSWTRSNPTPQIANDTAAKSGAAPGTTARPAKPNPSRSAPPIAATGAGACRTSRPRIIPSGSALTSNADCAGL